MSATENYSDVATDALVKLGVTTTWRVLTERDVANVRNFLFNRLRSKGVSGATCKVLRPIYIVGDWNDAQVKALCRSKFRVCADSVCDVTAENGLRETFDVVGEGRVAVVAGGLILGVAPHAGAWAIHRMLPHYKMPSANWRGALDWRSWRSWNPKEAEAADLVLNLAKCCERPLQIRRVRGSWACRFPPRKRRREEED